MKFFPVRAGVFAAKQTVMKRQMIAVTPSLQASGIISFMIHLTVKHCIFYLQIRGQTMTDHTSHMLVTLEL
jgi:hypothetical protein